MRIVIDASSLLLRSAGVKSYFYNWLLAMRQQAGADAIRAFPFLNDFGPLQHERSVVSDWATYPRLAAIYLAKLGFQPLFDIATHGASVFHVSNLVRTCPKRVKVTATVFDLTCKFLPEVHTAANVEADNGFVENVMKRAEALIAISESTRQDAIHHLDIAPERICTIWPGVAESYFDAVPLKRSKPYLLSVSTIEPRKNIATMLDAWEMLRPELRREYELVVAGATGWKSESVVARLNQGIEGVRYLGYVSEAEMPALTAGATALVYPSLYEGFGLPVAQALAAGTPAIASNNSSLPEVVADAGLLVDPKSPAGLAAAMERMLTSPSLRDALSVNARAQAKHFHWSEAATRSLAFFERVSG